MWSRNLRDLTGSYPEIVTALAEITEGRTILLDGELVALDDRGAPSFSRLQQRMHVQRPAPALIEQVRFNYIVFDLLGIDGRLRCIGGVGTGFTAATRRGMRARIDEIRRDTSPLDDPPPAPGVRIAWWVQPVLVADIEYREVSGDGLPAFSRRPGHGQRRPRHPGCGIWGLSR
ncbi:hypothetical protein [Nocardia sp. NPDC023988]|uniref:ATP dependent DNA ligase n=1 Tax=unclassified Nocardia TaxID=2637762 RepID=UPI0033FC2B4D